MTVTLSYVMANQQKSDLAGKLCFKLTGPPTA